MIHRESPLEGSFDSSWKRHVLVWFCRRNSRPRNSLWVGEIVCHNLHMPGCSLCLWNVNEDSYFTFCTRLSKFVGILALISSLLRGCCVDSLIIDTRETWVYSFSLCYHSRLRPFSGDEDSIFSLVGNPMYTVVRSVKHCFSCHDALNRCQLSCVCLSFVTRWL